MPKILSMYAFVAEDTGPEDEGIMAYQTTHGWVPLVGADEERMESLLPVARMISQETGKPFKMLRFTVREELPT